MIGGNLTAIIQVRDEGRKNEIGERLHEWTDVVALQGWLDYSGGEAAHTTFNAKIQDSTHIFLCDYRSMKALPGKWTMASASLKDGFILSGDIAHEPVDATSENARMAIDGQIYEILLIDNPMEMGQHYEIYLKYTGGQNGRHSI